MQNLNNNKSEYITTFYNDQLYSEDIEISSFNTFSIEDIKDYDELDVQIIKNLTNIKEEYNLIDIIIDNIKFDLLSESDFTCLLVAVSNNNIHDIIKYMNR